MSFANYILAKYETGTLATLLFFALCGSTGVYGLVRVSHFGKAEGWINVASALLLFLVFHNRFSRDDSSEKLTNAPN